MQTRIAASPLRTLVAGLVCLAASTAIAQAAPCAWTMEEYVAPPSDDAVMTCTCGPPPPGGLLLDLSEVLDAIEPDAPEPYPGSFMQTIGGARGTWTYSFDSNICLAARHAGLIEDPDFGAELFISVAPGCDHYEGSSQNGITTSDRGAYHLSFYFPDVSDGSCPGEVAQTPDDPTDIEDSFWRADRLPASGAGAGRCYAAGTPERAISLGSPSLFIFSDSIQLRPREELPETVSARFEMTVDGRDFLLPMAVRDGRAFLPLSIVESVIDRAEAMAVTLITATHGEERLSYPAAGMIDAVLDAAATCGWQTGIAPPETGSEQPSPDAPAAVKER